MEDAPEVPVDVLELIVAKAWEAMEDKADDAFNLLLASKQLRILSSQHITCRLFEELPQPDGGVWWPASWPRFAVLKTLQFWCYGKDRLPPLRFPWLSVAPGAAALLSGVTRIVLGSVEFDAYDIASIGVMCPRLASLEIGDSLFDDTDFASDSPGMTAAGGADAALRPLAGLALLTMLKMVFGEHTRPPSSFAPPAHMADIHLDFSEYQETIGVCVAFASQADVVGGLTALRASTKFGWEQDQDVFGGLERASGLAKLVWVMKKYVIGHSLRLVNATSLLLCQNLTDVWLSVDIEGDVAVGLLELPSLEDLEVRSVSALPRDVDRKTARPLKRVCLRYQLHTHHDLSILFRMTRASKRIWANRWSFGYEDDGPPDYYLWAALRLVTDRDRESCADLMKVLRFAYEGDELRVEYTPSSDLDVIQRCVKWFKDVRYTLSDGF
jgi:hypothetical protein